MDIAFAKQMALKGKKAIVIKNVVITYSLSLSPWMKGRTGERRRDSVRNLPSQRHTCVAMG